MYYNNDDEDINTTFLLLFIVCAFLFALGVSGGCVTPEAAPKVEACDTYMARTIQERTAAGFLPVESGTDLIAEGVVIWVKWVNVAKRQIALDALVDTPAAAKVGLEGGLKRVGECLRGDKAWTILTATVTEVRGVEASL